MNYPLTSYRFEELEEMEKIKTDSFMEYFSELEDPRIDRRKFYPLEEILLTTVAATICGAEGWVEIQEFGESKLEYLRSYYPFENGIPSHDTFGRVFSLLDTKLFETCFLNWVNEFQELNGSVVAIDGKRVRHSYDKSKNKSAIHVVSAFATKFKTVLAQEKVEDKSNEIIAIPKLLDVLNLKNTIITIDAMGCQRKIARKIKEKEADYVLALKSNQGNLFEDVKSLFEEEKKNGFKNIKVDFDKTIDAGHGRIETRKCWASNDIEWLEDKNKWAGIQSIAMIESIRETNDKTETETRLYIASLPPDAKSLNKIVRTHWSIENSLHWVLDVVFREDDSRIREENAPMNMAIIRHVSLNLINKARNNVSIKCFRKSAGWDNKKLDNILLTKF